MLAEQPSYRLSVRSEYDLFWGKDLIVDWHVELLKAILDRQVQLPDGQAADDLGWVQFLLSIQAIMNRMDMCAHNFWLSMSAQDQKTARNCQRPAFKCFSTSMKIACLYEILSALEQTSSAISQANLTMQFTIASMLENV